MFTFICVDGYLHMIVRSLLSPYPIIINISHVTTLRPPPIPVLEQIHDLYQVSMEDGHLGQLSTGNAISYYLHSILNNYNIIIL